ncbi:hypothetical protein GCM10010425_49160 [Streptomyces spororaveus]|uniref:Peptidase M48 domain-containing protein n=1 Tax=Streptomyces spororaveus TaxID=284039 RepID=A0ABQ3T296_9ACTN|nr:hypothetical protein [Streptomyces spororaveus]GHI74510.1 hypothetical protein Sspor_00710 [Streptomyces spororaveus]
MRIGELLDRWGVHLIVGALITGQVVSTAVQGPHPIAAYTSLVGGALWAWHGHHTSDRAISSGYFAQILTWDPFVRPHKAPDPTALYLEMAARMRQTEEHVHAFARRHGLERVSLALPGDRHSHKDARATGHGLAGHLWLGALWFHPDHTRHLPPVLEHELAHLRRRDTRTRLVVETCALVSVILASGLLPLWAFTVTALTAWLGTAALHWWAELACDAAAVRACGRTSVAGMWTADIADERTTPLAARAWNFIRTGHLHPPLRLRRCFALHAPLRSSDAPHPLSTPPGPLARRP